MKSLMTQKLEDPEYKSTYILQQKLFNQELIKLREQRTQSATLKIPVAVHFPAGNESDRNCLEALAQNQIDILNNDFKATNSDISTWINTASSQYPGINHGSLNVEFVIATRNHPANTDNDLTEGGKAVTIGYNFGNGGDSDPKWAGYLNFVIKDIGAGLLGYSPLGGVPNNGDSIVMNIAAFGSGSGCTGYQPQAPFDLGRTVTHELGHHFNLDHTWGDGGCNSDDNVADTPNIDQSSGGCPAPGSVVMCSNKSLTMNYMDYVNDSCMYMFTQGQAQRATAYINSILSQYKTNVFGTLNNPDFEDNLSFKLSPNPAKNNIILSFDKNLTDDSEVHIFDILGRKNKLVQIKRSETQKRIDISNLMNGVYLVRLISGNKSTIKKLIIKN